MLNMPLIGFNFEPEDVVSTVMQSGDVCVLLLDTLKNLFRVTGDENTVFWYSKGYQATCILLW